MNKKLTLCTLGICSILLGGCASSGQAKMDYIGLEQAKNAVLQETGFDSETVFFSDIVLDKRNDIEYYKVVFTSENETYEYDVDALTGTIIAAHTELTEDDTSNTSPEAILSDDSITPQTTKKESSGKKAISNAKITAEEAKAYALAHAQLSEDQVTFINASLDYDDGKRVYDVEFYTKDYTEYDYEIDAATGTVLSYDYDAETHYSNTGDVDSTADISVEKAKEIALSQVPGATADHLVQFKTDFEDGKLAYEGTIIFEGREYEFEIDGYSGAIREWDSESLRD